MNANHESGGELELSEAQRMQALVCAYVLDELDEAERKEVEAALERSPELRAEKARFEAAAGVVAGVLKERSGEALSRENAAELDAIVARRGRPSFFSTPLVRVAAGVAVALGAYAMYRELSFSSGSTGVRVESARAPAPDAQPAERADAKSSSSASAGREATQAPAAAPAESSPLDSAPPEETPPEVRDALDKDELVENEVLGETLEQLDLAEAGWSARQAREQDKLLHLGAPVMPEEKKPSSVLSVTAPAAPEPTSTGPLGGVKLLRGEAVGGKRGPGDVVPPAASARAGGAGGPGAADSKRAEAPKALLALGYSDGGAFDDDSEERVVGADEFFLGQSDKRRFRERRAPQTEADVLQQRYHQIREHCVLPIGPTRPRDMFFRYWGDNPFELALLDRQSTFSIDVDTASYTLARKYLVEGQLPTKEQIRTEEFVNYFKGDVPPPAEGTFAVATEFAPSLFGDDSNTWMLRVAVRGKEVSKAERQPVALTFVVDVSGSMREGQRLELVKHSLRLLVSQMDASDSISLIKFSNDAALILPMTSARQKDLIESAIHPLQPEGSTNTEAGLRMGYEQALAALTPNANNRVVLLTDGVANVGITDPGALVQMVERQRKAGIYLNTVGVGMNNHNDNLLEQLANKGDGLCNYVDDEQEVRRALVDNFTGAFQVIARDVKVQVEFDPAQVERYRLLGYENRAIADADFRNDKVDAGEVGAGHQVVALYEIVRRNVTGDGPLATVRLRWKPPFQAGVPENEQGAAQELAQPVHAAQSAASYAATSAGYRRSVLVAQFAEFLRRSVHARRDSLERLIDEARKLSSEMRDAEFDEFVDMAVRSRELIRAELARRDWLDDCGHLLRHRHYLHSQLDELRRRFPQRFDDPRLAAEFEAQLNALQMRLGELEARVAGERGAADAEMVKRLEAENIELQRRLMEFLDRARAEQDGK